MTRNSDLNIRSEEQLQFQNLTLLQNVITSLYLWMLKVSRAVFYNKVIVFCIFSRLPTKESFHNCSLNHSVANKTCSI